MRRRLVPLLVAAIGVSGCAAIGPASGTRIPETSAVAPTRAPRVAEPRDVRGIPACDLLTPAQLTALEINPNTAEPAAQGSADECFWRLTDGSGSLMVTSAPDFPVGGLEGLYISRPGYDVFEPGELDGFPIVRADRKDNPDTLCTIYVGVADDQLAWTSAAFAFKEHPACATALRMASAMLANLPPLR